METKMSFFQTWDDVVFENRNRAYGAYVIRKGYSRRVLLGSGITIALLALLLVFAERTMEAVEFVPPFVPKDKGGLTIFPEPPRKKLREAAPPERTTTRRADTDVKVVSTPVEMEPLDDSLLFSDTDGEFEGDGLPDGDESGVETGLSGVIDPGTDAPYTIVQLMPEYEGGDQAMMKFIRKHIRVPRSIRTLGVAGTVYVSFVVKGDGTVSDVTVIRGFHRDADKEAVRVIKMLPAWKGGRHNGLPVSVKMVLPIRFDVM